SSISSPRDVTALIIEVQRYGKWHSQFTNASRLKTTYNEPQPEISPAAIELIRAASDQKGVTEKQVDALIASLESFVRDAPVITITLAAPASLAVKKTLVDWCRANLQP